MKMHIFYSDITIIKVISNLKRLNKISLEISKDAYEKIKGEFLKDIAHQKIKTISVLSKNINVCNVRVNCDDENN